MIDDVVEIVEVPPQCVPFIHWPSLAISSVEFIWEAIKTLAEGEIALSVPMIAGGIENQGITLCRKPDIARPKITVQ